MKKAFTLIELLVVITIIGILAGLIIVNVSKARAKARDAERKSDISAIAVALELYYDDNGEYPSDRTEGYGGVSSTDSGWSQLENDLRPYLPGGLPKDPLNGKWITNPCDKYRPLRYVYWDRNLITGSSNGASISTNTLEGGGAANEGSKWTWGDNNIGRDCYFAVISQ